MGETHTVTDGDGAEAWEWLERIPAKPSITNAIHSMRLQLAAAEARVAALVEALEDFRDRGTRHDTTPTMTGHNDTGWWYDYCRSMDDSVRVRARAALAALARTPEKAGG